MKFTFYLILLTCLFMLCSTQKNNTTKGVVAKRPKMSKISPITSIGCRINFRKDPQGNCVPITKCCKDDSCKPLYIANPTYKTRVKKIVIPYAVFRRYPYSFIKKCPKGFKRVNKRQCLHEVKTRKSCPLTYFRVDDNTCMKVVSITKKKTYMRLKCAKGQKKS